MAILSIDYERAREVFPTRGATPLEIRVMWAFKAPLDSELLLDGEFEQLLDDGSTTREAVEEAVEALVKDEILASWDGSSSAHQGSSSVETRLAGELTALALLTSGIAGDVAAMGDWAQREVRVGDRDPTSLLASVREQLTDLRHRLRESRPRYIEEQGAARSAEDPLRLHLGCGTIRSEGWIDVDLTGGDLRLNLCWALPFPDASVSYVYSANTFEHLDYHTSAQRLLHEIHRVLIPGGTARLVMPDIGAFAGEYAAGNERFFDDYDQRRPAFAGMAGYRSHLAKVMRAAGSAARPTGWFEHKMGYDFATLADLLGAAGFDNIEHSSFQSSRDTVLREMDALVGETELEHDRLEYSLFVDAVK